MQENGGDGLTQQRGDEGGGWRCSHTLGARGCTRMVAVVAHTRSEGMHEHGGNGLTQQRGDARGWWRCPHTRSEGMHEYGGGDRTQQ